jgi:hypothetical protein
MSICSQPRLVYGFNIGDNEFFIDYCCLENKFPFVRRYSNCIIDNQLNETIHGIECDIDQYASEIIIFDEHRIEVRNLFDEYIEYLRKTYDNKEFYKKRKLINLKFHLVIDSNLENNKKPIILKYSEKEEEKEDEEDEEN